jgi:hypothetical protein
MSGSRRSRDVRRPRSLLVLVAAVIGVTGVVSSVRTPASAAVDVGYVGPSYGTNVSAPTGQKPESKLWFQDGSWWGVLYSDVSPRGFAIHRFDWGTNTWIKTAAMVDTRTRTSSDALWSSRDGKLYVATHIKEDVTTSNITAWLRRFSYDPLSGSYALDPGYPVAVVQAAVETMVVDQDSLGRIWITWTEPNSVGGRQVMVTHSTTDPSILTTPFVLPVGDAGQISADDISTLVAFDNGQGPKIGVLWSNQLTGQVAFATHRDSAGDSQWDFDPVIQQPNYADDHLNIKALTTDPQGRLYAAIKTSFNDVKPPNPGAPLIVLLTLDGPGSWQRRTVATVAENHTRPVVVIDAENQVVRVFMSAPCCNGGDVYVKSADLRNPNFESGMGELFLHQTGYPTINNVTSTKQQVDGQSGILLLAGDDTTHTYVFNKIDLSVAPVPDTSILSGPSDPTTATVATFDFASTVGGSTFECELDGAAFSPCSSPAAYSGLGLGPHTFAVRATRNGKTDPSPATWSWTVTAPVAIVRGATATKANTTASTSISVNRPAGVVPGDVLVACVAVHSSKVKTAPTGWDPIAASTAQSKVRTYGYYHVAGASEPGSYSWVLSSSATASAGIARYTGVDTSVPLDGAPSEASGGQAVTATVPSITTSRAGSMLVGCMGANSTAASLTMTPPAQLREVWNLLGLRQEYADALAPATGASGAMTWTFDSKREWAGWVAALRNR